MDGFNNHSYYCYIIHTPHTDRTYNGYTVNLERRLKQHNGFLKGGARATHNKGPWKYLVVLTSDCWECASEAMKHEWSIKYPTRRRPRPREYNGKMGRLRSLTHVFQHMKEKCGYDDEEKKLICYVDPEYYEFMIGLCEEFGFGFVEVAEREF